MKRISLNTGFAIFIIFFGLSLPDAVRAGNWAEVAFWLFMGGVFTYAGNMPVPHRREKQADQL